MEFKKKELGADEFESIFKYMPSLELLEFRSVSKTFDTVAQLVLRKRRDIKLFLTTNNCDGETNWEFLEFLIDSPETFVAQVMHIKNTNTSDQDLPEGGICTTFEIVKKICKILGNREKFKRIRHLIIQDGDNKSPHFNLDFLLAILYNLSSSLESLKLFEFNSPPEGELSTEPEFQLPLLKEIILPEGSGGVNYRNIMKIILTLTPNLTDFSCNLENLNLIPMLKETGRIQKMQAIVLTNQEDLDILIECQPKIALQKLSIEAKTLDVEKLQKYLQEQRGLKELAVSILKLEPDCEVRLPFLPLMEHLSFSPKFTYDSFFNLINGRNTPKLRSLCICSDDLYEKCWEVAFYEAA